MSLVSFFLIVLNPFNKFIKKEEEENMQTIQLYL